MGFGGVRAQLWSLQIIGEEFVWRGGERKKGKKSGDRTERGRVNKTR